MKSTKKLKLILAVLICVLIILFGFIGAYKKRGFLYKNILKDYKFASDISGATVMEFEVDSTVNKEYYDAEGKKVEESSIEEGKESEYTTKEIPVNSEEVLTSENYKKTAEIFKKRLNFLQANQYRIDLDKKTGKIIITVDDDYLSDIESILPLEGKLQLVDSITGDVIIDYTDLKSAESTYASLKDGYDTFINLELNKSGLEKIKDIDKYKTIEEKETEETTSENDEENANEENTETTGTPKFKLMFDTDQICEMEYDNNLITNGKTLRITTKSGVTSNSTLNSQLNMNMVVSKLASIGKLPVSYKLSAEEFIAPDILEYNNIILISGIVIAVALIIFLIIKYKVNGLLASIGFVTSIALTLVIIRAIELEISLNVISAYVATIIFNFILLNSLLKNVLNKEKSFKENAIKSYLDCLNLMVIIVILIAVFAFTSMSVISSMGLALFWGFICTLIGSIIFTVPMLSINNK